MPDLSTSYMGLPLRNPIIVGSSGLTNSVEKIAECERAGAGAVVVKSLFEEVLAREDWGLEKSAPFHPEAQDYLTSEINLQYGPNQYCDLLAEAKIRVKIPVIGSINCVSTKWWPEFAKKIEAAGADAIELNIFSVPTDTQIPGGAYENLYTDILKKVKSKIKIPVAIKISRYFTSLPHLVSQLDKTGTDAVVVFNRFTEPDIDIDHIKLRTTFTFSSEDDMYPVLRWVILLSNKVKCDISATTGIHTAQGAIKFLLAGAKTVQLASVLYQEGLSKLTSMIKEIETWMEDHQFKTVDEFRGKVNFLSRSEPALYLRAQFMEKIRNID